MLSYLLGHSDDWRGVQNVLIFTWFEQCFPILSVTPRTARRAECIDFYMLWATFSYLWDHFEACQESRMYWFLHAFSNVFLSSRSLRRLAGSAECVDFYMIWAMFSYLLGHFEDCQESRMYWFLRALSNVLQSLRTLWGLPGERNVLIFTWFQQCFPIF